MAELTGQIRRSLRQRLQLHISIPMLLIFGCLPVAAQAAELTFTHVGHPGRPADASGYGEIGYDYWISDEVSTALYRQFLTAKADDLQAIGVHFHRRNEIDAATDVEPVVLADPVNAARFINWLHNGRGEGETESGAYLIDSSLKILNGYQRIVRQPDARYVLPSVDEWYKAAYLEPAGLEQTSRHYAWTGEWTQTLLFGALYERVGDPQTYHYYLSTRLTAAPSSLEDFQAIYPLTPAQTFRVVSLVPEPASMLLILAPLMPGLLHRGRGSRATARQNA